MSDPLSARLKQESLFIDGAWVPASSGQTIDVRNPATGDLVGTVPNAGRDETRSAIEAASAAFPAWRDRTAADRAEKLQALAQAFLDNRDALAELLTLEQGKPLAEAKGEVGMSAAYIRWFAEEARRLYGDVIPSPWLNRRILVTKHPVGVVGAITPWNFPSSMLARKIGPALAAGCTVVAKPATQTPFSALAYGILAEQAGIPKGVVNVVTGSAREIGAELTSNPLVRKITFTGSTAVGKVLIGQAAATVKKVSMELGGNAPFIVFDDADLDAAVAGAIAAKFRNAGQTCVCTNRFYAQAGIYDAFVERLTEATRALRVGNGLDPETVIGPMIDEKAVEKARTLLQNALDKGGRVTVGGAPDDHGSSFFQPTVVAGATSEMDISREEIFGPIAAVFKFDTEEEAIQRANDTEYGLAAYFYTKDLGRTFRVSEKLEYGIVGVNEGLVTTEVAPFGGMKESGYGSEGSKYGLDDYVAVKYTCVGGLGR